MEIEESNASPQWSQEIELALLNEIVCDSRYITFQGESAGVE
jgi:hypothetical protein